MSEVRQYNLTVLSDNMLNYFYCIVKCSSCNKSSLIALGLLCSQSVPCPECKAELHVSLAPHTLRGFGKAVHEFYAQLRKARLTPMFLHNPDAMIEFEGKKS